MIVREPESQYVPAPAGVHAAVCVDEVDMGEVANRFDPDAGPVRTVRLVWQIGEDMADGKPYLIKKDYRASLHEKAALRKDLESWRGRPFKFDELVGFDLENIVGVHCMLNIVHKTGSKGGTFANIAAIMPLAKGMLKLEPRGYVRVKERPTPELVSQPKRTAPADEAEMPYHPDVTDDDVPFNQRPPLARASKERNENLLQMRRGSENFSRAASGSGLSNCERCELTIPIKTGHAGWWRITSGLGSC